MAIVLQWIRKFICPGFDYRSRHSTFLLPKTSYNSYIRNQLLAQSASLISTSSFCFFYMFNKHDERKFECDVFFFIFEIKSAFFNPLPTWTEVRVYVCLSSCTTRVWLRTLLHATVVKRYRVRTAEEAHRVDREEM